MYHLSIIWTSFKKLDFEFWRYSSLISQTVWLQTSHTDVFSSRRWHTRARLKVAFFDLYTCPIRNSLIFSRRRRIWPAALSTRYTWRRSSEDNLVDSMENSFFLVFVHIWTLMQKSWTIFGFPDSSGKHSFFCNKSVSAEKDAFLFWFFKVSELLSRISRESRGI